MTLRTAAVAATLLAASLVLSVSNVNASAEQPQTGRLPHGGAYIVDVDPTVGAAAVGLWFRAPGSGYDNATPGLSRLAATAAAAAPLQSGKSLLQSVRALGGDVSISVYADIVGIDAVVPAAAARQAIAGLTAAYFAARIDDAAVATAQRDGAVLAVQQRYSVPQTLQNMLFGQIFTDGPAHDPPLPTNVAQVTRITPDQVRAFAARAFRSSNAILTVTGNVDPSNIDAVTDGTGKGSIDAPYDSRLAATPRSTTAMGQVAGIGLAWVGPPIGDEKAATALDFVADYLFRDGTGIVAKALDTDDTYLLGQFVTLHDPGVLVVTIGSDVPTQESAAKQHVLDAIAGMEQPMDAQAFAAAREAFLYHVASDTQTPQERADNLGWYAAEGNGAYAPGVTNGSYEQAVRALDPGYVAAIVRQYLSTPVSVTLVVAPPEKEEPSS